MRLKFCDGAVTLELKVRQCAGLYGPYSLTKARIEGGGELIEEWVWMRNYRSDEELETSEVLDRTEALVARDISKIEEAVDYSTTAVMCAYKDDKVEVLIREGQIWQCAALLASLLLARHTTPSEAVKEIEQVKESLKEVHV